MTQPALFIHQLMLHILEGNQIPKVQVERVVGPILGFFLAEVLTASLQKDEMFSGKYRVLCPEFPLLKPMGRQSSNVDWLLYNETRQELVFLELKTASGSFCTKQAATYLEKRLQVLDQGAGFLVEDLKRIERASLAADKYAFVQELLAERFPNGLEALDACRKAQVMYLVPATALQQEGCHLKRMGKVLTFSELADQIDGPFASEWYTICHVLRQLDGNGKATPPKAAAKNYQAHTDFEQIKRMCHDKRAQIIVGFTGGEQALQQATLSYLRQRTYKWDQANGGHGHKDQANWINGDRFLAVVSRIEADHPATSAPLKKERQSQALDGVDTSSNPPTESYCSIS